MGGVGSPPRGGPPGPVDLKLRETPPTRPSVAPSVTTGVAGGQVGKFRGTIVSTLREFKPIT